MEDAFRRAEWSKDPSTKVGCVIVQGGKDDVSYGFNGFPPRLEDTECRLHDRNFKYKAVLHAELNAILAAGRKGVDIRGSALYCTHPVCTHCASAIIASQIAEVIISDKSLISDFPDRWKEDTDMAKNNLEEAGVKYRILSDK